MKTILSLFFIAGLATAYSGDLTYYTTGVGSCGFTSTDNDAIVALSLPMVSTSHFHTPIPQFGNHPSTFYRGKGARGKTNNLQ